MLKFFNMEFKGVANRKDFFLRSLLFLSCLVAGILISSYAKNSADSISKVLLLPLFLLSLFLMLYGFVGGIGNLNRRLKDIAGESGHLKAWLIYIALGIIPVVGLLNLSVFFLPSKKTKPEQEANEKITKSA